MKSLLILVLVKPNIQTEDPHCISQHLCKDFNIVLMHKSKQINTGIDLTINIVKLWMHDSNQIQSNRKSKLIKEHLHAKLHYEDHGIESPYNS